MITMDGEKGQRAVNPAEQPFDWHKLFNQAIAVALGIATAILTGISSPRSVVGMGKSHLC